MKSNPVLRLTFGIILTALLVASLILSSVRNRAAQKTVFGDFFFDTYVSFTLYGCEDISARDELLTECTRYEQIFSATAENSELFLLNSLEWAPDALSGAMVVPISKELYECMSLAQKYCLITEGRYNIAVRPITELWDFSSSSGHNIPDISALSTAVDSVLSASYTLNDNSAFKNSDGSTALYTITLKTPGIRFDLGSVAKGYIADNLHDYILDNGIAESAIIDLGGNICCVGAKPNFGIRRTTSFAIGIQAPFSPVGTATMDVSVTDKSVVTSGIYQRYFTEKGILYHHILDATTGYPAGSDVVSVSVISDSSARADILSTVCFILGEEKARALLSEEGADAIFIYEDGSYSTTY